MPSQTLNQHSSSDPGSQISSSDLIMPSSPLPTRNTAADVNETKTATPTEGFPNEVSKEATNGIPNEPSDQPTNPRLIALQAKKANLEAKLAALKSERLTLATRTKLPSGLAIPNEWTNEEKLKQALLSSNAVIKEHIALLHRYNEIKDVGQGLMGLIAETRGVRVVVVQEEYGMGEKD
ncbi:Hypothetical protein R9X50_00354200 [Acrodontium crateriforme]|uniref:Swi5-domain-containing protein n=1 Tax=Acrodontium crateriforme TaxID=150365 RepID=A0AAQ3M498_9PEZI|nr:Hypothetical protein R9X50_00354200 [Acrodontium crateriforme]